MYPISFYLEALRPKKTYKVQDMLPAAKTFIKLCNVATGFNRRRDRRNAKLSVPRLDCVLQFFEIHRIVQSQHFKDVLKQKNRPLQYHRELVGLVDKAEEVFNDMIRDLAAPYSEWGEPGLLPEPEALPKFEECLVKPDLKFGNTLSEIMLPANCMVKPWYARFHLSQLCF